SNGVQAFSGSVRLQLGFCAHDQGMGPSYAPEWIARTSGSRMMKSLRRHRPTSSRLLHPQFDLNALEGDPWCAMSRTRTIAVVAAALGLVFAVYSTYDYAQHLDRQMHAVHCSFIPGAPAGTEDSACKAALFSPYSAIFRATWWGGIPISLFAVGAFSFFAA